MKAGGLDEKLNMSKRESDKYFLFMPNSTQN